MMNSRPKKTLDFAYPQGNGEAGKSVTSIMQLVSQTLSGYAQKNVA
jgi:hypothetical protein